MNLPQNEKLNIVALSRAFSDMSESYKLFWFKGIMEAIEDGKSHISFRELISNMITSAWYMVSEFHLNLGPSDTLERLVIRAKEISALKPSSKPEEVKTFISNTNDTIILGFIKVLTLNVPYRFQAPFMPDFRGNGSWNSRQRVIDRVNGDCGLIYSFGLWNGLDTEIVINPAWQEYLSENRAIISGWIEYNMITYLQRRNPTVPGIANKLKPPIERKLDAAKKFWKCLSDIKPIVNIYSTCGELITNDDISIDHFVPWSYVAHDELWNLVPTSKSLNSSKSDGLPAWDKYFPKFCDVEYLAYQTVWENEKLHSLLEKCRKDHMNSDDVALKLYSPGIEKAEYAKRLETLILPAYTAARNMGFTQWKI